MNDQHPDRKQPLKLIQIMLSVITGVAFLIGAGLMVHYAYTTPTAADAATGRVFRLGYHGTTVYLTAKEDFSYKACFFAAAVSGAVNVAIEFFSGRFR